ncbi:hypothetical protein CRUP_018997 [Coryphaenoides rupestris]|nr:hypothetical protein CRUP_018997 [Coryphaenoides rupestris]
MSVPSCREVVVDVVVLVEVVLVLVVVLMLVLAQVLLTCNANLAAGHFSVPDDLEDKCEEKIYDSAWDHVVALSSNEDAGLKL